jgi:hypothetical protein
MKPDFLYMKPINYAGPINKNCRSFKKEAFWPSILWSMKRQIHSEEQIGEHPVEVVME